MRKKYSNFEFSNLQTLQKQVHFRDFWVTNDKFLKSLCFFKIYSMWKVSKFGTFPIPNFPVFR